MKKVLCICLCAALLLGATPVFAAEKPEAAGCPVILIPGVLESELYLDKGEKTEKLVWPPIGSTVLSGLRHIAEIVLSFARSDAEGIRGVSAKLLYDIGEPLRMHPDGTSVHNISPLVSTAAESSYDALKKAHKLIHATYGTTMLRDAAKIVGGDRAFVFHYDWRRSSIDVADDLHAFIRDVKKMTGSDKVNVSGTSFGSSVILCYLDKYGRDGELHHALMNSPAYGGSEIFYEMLCASETPSRINNVNILDMLMCNYGMEADVGYLLNLLPDGSVGLVFQALTEDYIKPYFISSVGFWGCCATKDYAAAKAQFLDPEKNAHMIEKADAEQAVMARTAEILQTAQSRGTQVYAIVNEGSELVTCHGSGDVLVDAASASGGVCLPVGAHFDDAYAPARIVCRDPAHNHVSYSGSIDLTNAFLPENTWVFYGQMHGQNYWDKRARELSLKILTTEEIRDVYSDPAYPQFSETGSIVSDVSLTLQDSPASILHPADGAVSAVLQNHSRFHAVYVKSFDFNDLPYGTEQKNILLLPGQSKTITLSPTGQTAQNRYGSITLRYDEFPNLKLHKSRTQIFCLAAS